MSVNSAFAFILYPWIRIHIIMGFKKCICIQISIFCAFIYWKGLQLVHTYTAWGVKNKLIFTYCISKKSCPFLYSDSLDMKMDKAFRTYSMYLLEKHRFWGNMPPEVELELVDRQLHKVLGLAILKHSSGYFTAYA